MRASRSFCERDAESLSLIRWGGLHFLLIERGFLLRNIYEYAPYIIFWFLEIFSRCMDGFLLLLFSSGISDTSLPYPLLRNGELSTEFWFSWMSFWRNCESGVIPWQHYNIVFNYFKNLSLIKTPSRWSISCWMTLLRSQLSFFHFSFYIEPFCLYPERSDDIST